jgi:hypothetical protein
MSIAASAVLVKLSISTWTANKIDRVQTDRVLADNNASGKAAQVRKNLMAGTQKIKDIMDFAAMCRTENNKLTLPWEDRGNRLLPTSMFLDYKQRFNGYKNQFIQMRGDIAYHYDALCQTSRNYLGDMYDESDYPPVEEVIDKYDWQLTFSPVPDAGHFYLDIPANELEEVKDSLNKENDVRLKDATRTAWDRLHTLLQGMTSKLTETDDSKTKRWHDTFITNADELCMMLTHLNVTKDPALEQARKMLQASINGVQVDTLKVSPTAREDLKSKVDDIIKQFEW